MELVACALLGGVCAGLLAVSLARGTGRRRPVAAGYLSLLAALMLAGCRPAPKATIVATAPVDASISLYSLVSGCSACPIQNGLVTYSARDGSTRWIYTPPAPGFMTDLGYALTYHAGMLFAYTWQEGDAQHATLTAIRAADGKPLWHVRVLGSAPPLATAGDYVVVETETGSITIPPHLLVLRAADGAQLHDIPLTLGGLLAADGDGAYICSGDGMLSAYRLSSGQPLWKIAVIPGAPRTDYEGECVPKAADGTLYYLVNSHISVGVATPTVGVSTPTPNSTDLVAARESDGHVLWRQPLLDTLPVVHDGLLFAAIPSNRPGAGRYDTDLAAFRASDGVLLWRVAGGPPGGGPIVKSGPVVVFARGTALVAVGASDGAPLWQRQLPNRALIPIGATSGVVLADSITTFSPRSSPPSNVDTNPYVVALRPSDGATDWQIPAGFSAIVMGAEP